MVSKSRSYSSAEPKEAVEFCRHETNRVSTGHGTAIISSPSAKGEKSGEREAEQVTPTAYRLGRKTPKRRRGTMGT